jgi:predicted dehydrogenase
MHEVTQVLPDTRQREDNTAGLIRTAVIGCGYWGPNLIRNFFEAPTSTVSYACDLNGARLASIGTRYPTITLTDDYKEVLNDPKVDAVVIATPVSTHFPLAKQALEAGKHVWVEKPLALSYEDAQRLTELAERKQRTLMVDHTFIYTPAIQRLRASIDAGELGDLLYYDSVRVNLGIYQHDVNVIWDLGVHDASIMDYLLPHKPVGVSAVAAAHIVNGSGASESIAYVTVHFEENLIAHFHLNWLAPVKIRQITVCGTNRMIVYDDNVIIEKVRIYDRGVVVHPASKADRNRLSVEYRTGDMYAPKLDQTEALQAAAIHFADCIASGTRPFSDGEAGSRTVALVQAAQRSLACDGGLQKVAF